MTCEAYILNWNELDTIRLTIKHYQQFCDRIVIYDNYSDDGSDNVALSMGCEVRKFGIPGVLSDASYRKLKNTCWKGSQSDWVIICDADEILYHSSIKSILANEKEATIFKTQGYQIFSEELPKENWNEIRTGFTDNNYSKSVIFNPRRITDINFEYGAHTSNPQGFVSYSSEVLPLLHFRNCGGFERLRKRHASYRKRMSPDNKRLGLGIHYQYEDERREKEWYEQLRNSVELSLPGGW